MKKILSKYLRKIGNFSKTRSSRKKKIFDRSLRISKGLRKYFFGQRNSKFLRNFSIVVLLCISIIISSCKKEVSLGELSIDTQEANQEVGKLVDDKGAKDDTAIKATKVEDKPGNILSGKEIILNKGNYKAIFAIKIDDLSNKNVISDIYVDGLDINQDGFSKEIYAKDFLGANEYTNFELDFSVNYNNTIVKPRVFYTGESNLWFDYLKIESFAKYIDNKVDSDSTVVIEEAKMGRKSGELITDKDAKDGKAIIAREGVDSANHIVFGPYSEFEDVANHNAIFRLKINDNTITEPVVKLEAFNANGDGVNKTKIIKGTDFTTNNKYQDFSLNFYRGLKGSMEYRVYYYGKGDVSFDNVSITGPVKNTLQGSGTTVENGTGKTTKSNSGGIIKIK